MNRLIIIGNGFDLAHGIKTSYKDFIADYLRKAIILFNYNGFYADNLLEIKWKEHYRKTIDFSFDLSPSDVKQYINHNLLNKNAIDFKFNSTVLKNSYNKFESMNWVDLEIEYFNVLLKAKNNNQSEGIYSVNEHLDLLKEKLIEYLKEQQSIFTNGFIKNNLVGCFTESIHPHEIVTAELEADEKPENLFFLNFNYTNTFEVYFDSCRKIIPSQFDYIHGDLHGVHGQPIFGFGDELDKQYLEFEDENNNELFKHIKSFEYLKNKNYYNLIRFIESGDYQVQIYGHSCGLSDRTMLNQIFEHKYCKSIKIFYHERPDGTNDYTEKTYEISRHFKDKGMMRKKIVPLDFSKPMPQPMNLK